MRTSKLLVAVGAVAVCANYHLASADDVRTYGTDNPAQAAARAALLNELQQPGQPVPTPVIKTPPPSPFAPPVTTGITPDTPAQAAARAALLNELQQPGQPPSVEQPRPIVVKSAPPAVVKTPPQSSPFAPPVVTGITPDTPAQAAARAALLKQLEKPVQPAPAPAATVKMPASVQAAPAPAVALSPLPQTITVVSSDNAAQAAARKDVLSHLGPTYVVPPTIKFNVIKKTTDTTMAQSTAIAGQTPGVIARNGKPDNKNMLDTSGYKPIVAPPLPISTDKQSRLEALTTKYRADQITPHEYFKQREAILNH